MSWPEEPRIRIRPIGPGAPMRSAGAPRSTLARGASAMSGRWPSRVWMTSMRRSRARSSSARHGTMAALSSETSLPRLSPKPPGSMKSRCMSMMSSAVRSGSMAIRGPARRRSTIWPTRFSSHLLVSATTDTGGGSLIGNGTFGMNWSSGCPRARDRSRSAQTRRAVPWPRPAWRSRGRACRSPAASCSRRAGTPSAPSIAKTAFSSGLSIACTVVGKRSVDGNPKSSWMPRATVSQRCVWQLTSPGNTALPRPSTRSAAG